MILQEFEVPPDFYRSTVIVFDYGSDDNSANFFSDQNVIPQYIRNFDYLGAVLKLRSQKCGNEVATFLRAG